jgi:hypothetical protein
MTSKKWPQSGFLCVYLLLFMVCNCRYLTMGICGYGLFGAGVASNVLVSFSEQNHYEASQADAALGERPPCDMIYVTKAQSPLNHSCNPGVICRFDRGWWQSTKCRHRRGVAVPSSLLLSWRYQLSLRVRVYGTVCLRPPRCL